MIHTLVVRERFCRGMDLYIGRPTTTRDDRDFGRRVQDASASSDLRPFPALYEQARHPRDHD